MQKTETGRLLASGQGSQKIFGRPHLIRKKLGVVMHTLHPSYGRKYKIGES
jgi:hypothetical protein